jgi:hypothetical protein
MVDYYVQYQIQSSDQWRQAGPYCQDEIEYRYNDIKSYERVKNVSIIGKKQDHEDIRIDE